MHVSRCQTGDQMEWGCIIVSMLLFIIMNTRPNRKWRRTAHMSGGCRFRKIVQRWGPSRFVPCWQSLRDHGGPGNPCQIWPPKRNVSGIIIAIGIGLTFSKRRCQYGSHSWPAALMHSSTAIARSGRILRTLSSDLGNRCVKLSQASYRIADGAVEPGRKTDRDEAEKRAKLG